MAVVIAICLFEGLFRGVSSTRQSRPFTALTVEFTQKSLQFVVTGLVPASLRRLIRITKPTCAVVWRGVR